MAAATVMCSTLCQMLLQGSETSDTDLRMNCKDNYREGRAGRVLLIARCADRRAIR